MRKHADSRVLIGSLALEAGSWNRYGGTADLSTPLNADGSVRARVVASYRDQDGFVDLEQTRTTTLYGVLDADLGDRTHLSLGISDQHDDAKSPMWFGLPAWYADGTRTDRARSKTTQADWAFGTTISKACSHRWIIVSMRLVDPGQRPAPACLRGRERTGAGRAAGSHHWPGDGLSHRFGMAPCHRLSSTCRPAVRSSCSDASTT